MKGSCTQSRFAELVSLFCVSALLLLSLLTVKQQEANTVTAQIMKRATVMTNYRQRSGCIVRVRQPQGGSMHFRMCRNIEQ